MNKTIITVVGKDTVGIIAKVCTYLAQNQINILDISQTIVQGFFNMMMIVDTNGMDKHFGEMADELKLLGENIGVDIKCQKEEILIKCTGFNGLPALELRRNKEKDRGKYDQFI